MHFGDHDTPYPYLEIVGDKQNWRAKVLALKVHPLVIGAFPIARKLLDTSLDLAKWSKKETKDVLENFSGKSTSIRSSKFPEHEQWRLLSEA
ncbi:hypothetical protein A4A49_62675 [Nicotiana attenuata]|uniref:Uncharacterized protein n=1 Tax=Nicotiana attenuata TaxID=49451 RepID=A0A1J6IW96_NICAT|nr:hypothetical protein A4A49_62675 [Nicotiana attenuata]